MPEEINLNQPNSSTPDHTKNNAPHMEIKDVRVPISIGTDNASFVQELINTPTDQLIPWEEVPLPSLGIYYGWADGTIQVRAMGQAAEKVLANQRLAQSGQSIEALFAECCRFPDGFAPSDLLLGDRVFLLYYLRGITHGNMYEFSITCANQSCEKQSTHEYDLNELASTIRYANKSLGLEPFRVVLPYLSEATKREVWVGVRFLRAYDANEMIARRRLRKKAFAKPGTRPGSSDHRDAADSLLSDNIEKMIVTICDQQVDPFGVKAFVNKLHSRDTSTLREWLRDNAPGIDSTVKVTCPECGTEIVTELPISDSFFRSVKRSRI